jgi:hypothetical protein
VLSNRSRIGSPISALFLEDGRHVAHEEPNLDSRSAELVRYSSQLKKHAKALSLRNKVALRSAQAALDQSMNVLRSSDLLNEKIDHLFSVA